MGADPAQKTLFIRIAIVIILLAAVAGVLYAKHTRGTDAAAKAKAPRCPCSAHKPVTPGE